MAFDSIQRSTRRRSSAGPQPPARPNRPSAGSPPQGPLRTGYLVLRDIGKVYLADLPGLPAPRLNQVGREARLVLESLDRRLRELDQQPPTDPSLDSGRGRAAAKRDATQRFIRAVDEELARRQGHPSPQPIAGESVARAFLELARQRLAGASFDALLQEARQQCLPHEPSAVPEALSSRSMPVVLSPDPSGAGA